MDLSIGLMAREGGSAEGFEVLERALELAKTKKNEPGTEWKKHEMVLEVCEMLVASKRCRRTPTAASAGARPVVSGELRRRRRERFQRRGHCIEDSRKRLAASC